MVYAEKPSRSLASPVSQRVVQREVSSSAAVEVAAVGDNAGTGPIVKEGVVVY